MQQTLLSVALIVVSILLSTAILLQQRGTGLGLAFGGDTTIFRTKRGLEKALFYVTIALSCLFFGIAFLSVLFA
jgi:preprotein translocase subunit SecG